MKKAELSNGLVRITFTYDKITIAQVKTLPDRRWNPEGKYWTCTPGEKTIQSLKDWGFELAKGLETYLEVMPLMFSPPLSPVPPINITDFKKSLLLFQQIGLGWLEQKKGRGLLADEMRLGKTIQTLAWLQLHPEIRPAIIVSPATVKLNWQKEIKECMTTKETTQVLSGTKSTTIQGSIIIINYDIIRHWVRTIQAITPKVIILDEAHHIKNQSARRTKATKILCKGVPHIIALTGTPVVSRPIELYNAIKLIAPNLFPDLWGYARRYCNLRHNGFGWDMKGASNTEELHQKLINTIMLRRTQAEVLDQLPKKLDSVIPLEINSRDYTKAETDFIKTCGKIKPADALAKIEWLKQVAVQAKLPLLKQWIRDYIEENNKLVVFTTHHFTIDKLAKEFEKSCIILDGRTPPEEKQKIQEQFQTNPAIKLLIGNIKVAGEGIDLSASNAVAFAELGWTPKDHDQARDRILHLSKAKINAKPLIAYYLIAANTIEEDIVKLIDRKRKVVSKIVDGKEIEVNSLLSELLTIYKSKS